MVKLTDELRSQVQDLLTEATDHENEGNRSDLLKRYNGEPYGDEQSGRSQFIDTSAQDAVEAILPEIMEVFTSAPDIVEFVPVGPEDEAAAEQETAAVSHIFWQKNNGFLTLYTWLKEAMIQQNAYVWHGWVEEKTTEIEEYEDLSIEEWLEVISAFDEGEYDVEEQTGVALAEDPATGVSVPVQEIDESGQPIPISLRVRCTKERKEYRVEPFPQEDFFITPRWHSLSLHGAPVCGRRHRDKTREDWIAYGFSEDSVERLTEAHSDDESTAARHHTRDVDDTDESDKYLEVFEVYVHLDSDKDGASQLLRVWCSEDAGHIMEWEDGKEAVDEVASVPIVALSPYIMPHRHIGQSVVEKVDDIQRVKTVLMRQILDNTYLTNYPRPQFDPDLAGEDALEDLVNPAPGAPIRSRAPIQWTAPQPVANSILPLLEKFDGLQEVRTGATRYNQGLDAESLNKTASGISQIMGASQKKAKLIARTFAETGLRELFLGIHASLRKGPVKEMMLRLKGQWAPVNPRTWKHRTDMVVNVGMGRGDRDERRQALMMAGQVQRELIAAGSRMVNEENLYQTITDTLKTFEIDKPGRYFNDPSQMPPPPPPQPQGPDPIMISAQAQAGKAQADAQIAMMKAQADERQREREHEAKMAELRLREIELTNRIQNERETLDLKEREAVMKDDLARDQMAVRGTPAVPYGRVTGSKP